MRIYVNNIKTFNINQFRTAKNYKTLSNTDDELNDLNSNSGNLNFHKNQQKTNMRGKIALPYIVCALVIITSLGQGYVKRSLTESRRFLNQPIYKLSSSQELPLGILLYAIFNYNMY